MHINSRTGRRVDRSRWQARRRQFVAVLAAAGVIAGAGIVAGVPGGIGTAEAAPPVPCTNQITDAAGTPGNGAGSNPCTGYGISGFSTGIQVTRGGAVDGTRWMGSYQSNSLNLAALFGVPEFWVVGTCIQDSGTHPRVTSNGASVSLAGYANSIDSEIPYLATARYLLEKTNVSGLPGGTPWTINGQTFTLDQWWAGMWVFGHYVAQDASTAGIVVVPSMTNPTTDPNINAAANALRNAGIASPGPWSTTTSVVQTGQGTGNIVVTVLDGNGDTVPGENIPANTSGANEPFLYTGSATAGLTINGQTTIGGSNPIAGSIIILSTPNAAGVSTTPFTYGAGVNGATINVATTNFTPGADMQVYQAAGQFITLFQFASVGSNGSVRLTTPAFLTVNKNTDDAYLPVTGAVLQLRSGNGTVLDTATVASGQAVFEVDDVSATPGPYQVFETSAPAGYVPLDPNVAVLTFASLSTSPTAPTTGDVLNEINRLTVEIEKVLDIPEDLPEGEDLSGFEFTVTRDDGTDFGVVTTGADGVSDFVEVTPGVFEVCETDVPTWAEAFTDPADCVDYSVPTSTLDAAELDWTFTNVIRIPNVATVMSTPVAVEGQEVTDRVWLSNTVAGRELRADMALYGTDSDTAAADVVCDAGTLVAPITATFAAVGGEQIADVTFTIPAGTDGQSLWAAGQITDVATGIVVADLGCGDINERVAVIDVETVSPAAANIGDEIIDTYNFEGIPAETIGEWDVELTMPLYDVTAGCEADSPFVGEVIETVTGNGTVTAGSGVATDGPGLFVFREFATVTYPAPVTPEGFTLPHPDGAVTELVTAPELCNNNESTWVPEVVTQVQDKILTGQPSVDLVAVSGIPAELVDGESVTIIGGLYSHDGDQPMAERTCDASNRVAAITPIVTTGSGDYTTEAIVDYPSGVNLSYQEQLEVVRVKELNGEEVVVEFTTAPHGCQVEDQTSWVPTVITQVQEKILSGEPGDRSFDTINVVGFGPFDYLSPEWTITVKGGFHQHDASAPVDSWVCNSANQVATIDIPGIEGNGTVVSDGEFYTPGFAYSYQEWLEIDWTNDGRIERFTTPKHGCQVEDQTTWAPKVVTQVANVSPSGNGTMTDEVTVTGLPASMPEAWTVLVTGGLHQHGRLSPMSMRVCDADNMVAPISFEIDGNGTFTSPGEKFTAGFAYSYQERLEVDLGDGEAASVTAWHGCQEQAQSFVASVAQSSGALAAAGGSVMLAVWALFVTAGGFLLLLVVRRRRQDDAGLVA